MSRRRFVGLLVLSIVCASGTASAHPVGGTRFDAPIPLGLLFGGAAATVAITAVLLAVLSTRTGVAIEASGESPALRVPAPLGDAVATAARLSFFLLVALSVVVGFVGPAAPAENLATLFVWAIWLKGVAVLAALVGDPWPTLSPWKTVYDALARLEGEAIAIFEEYPERLGEWPALVGVVLWIGVAANLTVLPRSPTGTALLVLGYAVAMLAGGVAFGPTWFERADALAVLYRLFGRVAPIEVARSATAPDRSATYELSVRPPWRGCTLLVRSLGAACVVVASVYTVSFDAFTGTREYRTALFALRDATGLGPQASLLLYLSGLSLFVGAFWIVAAAADRFGDGGATDRDDERGRRSAATAFAPTLLPIAVAYEIGHNYPYVIRNAAQAIDVGGRYVAATPVDVAPLAWLSVQGFWWSQVLLIVVGHLVAVVAGYAVTAERSPSPRAAARSHAPIALLMIGYTVVSLWTISRPVVA